MRKEVLHRRHPSQYELMLHAEAVMAAAHPIDGLIAEHTASCPACAVEVEAICASMRLVAKVSLVEPTLKSQTALMMRVRKERRTRERLHKGGRGVVRIARGTAYAAAVVIIAALAFGAALGGTTDSGAVGAWNETPGTSAMAQMDAEGTRAALEDTFATVRTLSKAVQHPSSTPLSPELQKQKRAVDALSADLAAAQEALTRNPGNERASAVMSTSLEQQAQTLRGLYIQGSR